MSVLYWITIGISSLAFFLVLITDTKTTIIVFGSVALVLGTLIGILG